MTTHFVADDLFVDTVLRSRDGKRDRLFTAARGGKWSYDTRTHVAGTTKAVDGRHNYGGLGVFGDYAMPFIEGLHFTGHVKIGLFRNEFNSNIAGAYWGAHLATHYDWNLTQSIRSRVVLSYFYDGRGDENLDIAGKGDVGGAHVSYDAVCAHRVQLESMFEFAVSDTWPLSRPHLRANPRS